MQYAGWLEKMLHGDWGWSIGFKRSLAVSAATDARNRRVVAVVIHPVHSAGRIDRRGNSPAARRGKRIDHGVQLFAFIGTAIPIFLLAFVMLAIFYIGLKIFPLDRLSDATKTLVASDAFHSYTGLVTIDGLLNGRPDVSLDALRHLAMPVLTLARWRNGRR
ncbi:MAG: hypothetical protein U0559_10315 [Anaerolineae bacterium]